MKKIILVQHCQSEHHINNMSGGWTDTPLTDLGRKQADLIGERLKKEISIDDEYNLYSSDFMRAKQTADIIDKKLNLGVIEEFGLREVNTGIAAGKTKEWVMQNQIPMTEGFNIDHRSFPGGETWREFYSRVIECMEKIYCLNQKNLIIITHGCTLAYIIAWWLKFTPEMLKNAVFTASPASISILDGSMYNQRVLRLLNDTSHLMEL